MLSEAVSHIAVRRIIVRCGSNIWLFHFVITDQVHNCLAVDQERVHGCDFAEWASMVEASLIPIR